jgi:cell division protein FtsL
MNKKSKKSYLKLTKQHKTIGLIVISLTILFVGYIIWANNRTYNGLELETKTYCSDVCPQYTKKYRVYKNIDTLEKCESVKGKPIYDPGWGAYIGCGPR